jgi:uncharacterized protein (TIGR03435 family)
MARYMNVLLSGKLSFLTARLICIAALMGFTVSAAFAQANAVASDADSKAAEVLLPGAVYDVATIKPSNPNAQGGGGGMRSNGTYYTTGESLKNSVCGAYGVMLFQCLGGPAWFESDHYDIEAKPDSATQEQLQTLGMKQRMQVYQRMQQALFADRLKLKVHYETREMPIFALVVAKGGLKMHESKDGDTYANGLKGSDSKAFGRGAFMVGNGKITAQGMSMDALAGQLAATTSHIVSNKTGLMGVYDFTLKFSDDLDAKMDSSAPSFYTALQEQLGLKLESAKGPVDVLVIDHAERPSAN